MSRTDSARERWARIIREQQASGLTIAALDTERGDRAGHHGDAEEVKSHLDEVLRSTVEQTLNSLLDEKADRMAGAGRYGGHRTGRMIAATALAAMLTLPEYPNSARTNVPPN